MEKKKGKQESEAVEPTPTAVKVYGVEYHINTMEDPAYARRVAEYVDRKMREISRESRVMDQSKLAVLTAMDVADELLVLRKKRYAIIGRTGAVAERLARTVGADAEEEARVSSSRQEK